MSNRLLTTALGLSLLAAAGCDLEVPDLNNPGIGQLQVDPSPPSVNAASTGLLVGQRAAKATTVGLVNQLGILGREAYDFDPNDGRFVSELVQGNLQKTSAFGGVFWAQNFNTIRLAYLIVDALDKIDPAIMADSDKNSMRGFAHTIMAGEFLTVIVTHRETGAPIDVDHPPTAPLAPFVSQDAVYAEIIRLLDLGLKELNDSLPATKPEAAAFTFPLSAGYAGFDTPQSFKKVNRALKARVAAYIASRGPAANRTAAYQVVLDALAESFIVDDPLAKGFSFNTGVFYVYSLNTGDATNGLTSRPIFAHPKLKDDAQKQTDGMTLDARYVAKVRDRTAADSPGSTAADTTLTTTVKFKMYTNVTPIPWIRNEDLILLKAEALWFTGQHDAAVTELNIVRTGSGKLTALTVPTTFTTDDQFIDALLYERRYSLLYEGGHRWNDLLRFGRSTMDQDAAPDMHTANVRYPVPQAECDARPGEAACNVLSCNATGPGKCM